MELIELKRKICESFSGSTDELNHVLEMVSQDRSVFPFNEYEHLIFNLIELGGLTYHQYLEIRSEYIGENPCLWIFEISAPTTFGKFTQTYAQGKSAALKNPSKKIDPNYSNEYDLWLDGIKIEVKASRVVNRDSDEPLYVKALSRNIKQPFLMNF